MKFFIFNIIVFCSLGYLLTSKSNENFNEWLVNTKEKVSQITKEEVISTVKKATSKNKEENLVKTLINEDKQQKEKIDEFDQNNKQKNINYQNDKEKENNLKLKKIFETTNNIIQMYSPDEIAIEAPWWLAIGSVSVARLFRIIIR